MGNRIGQGRQLYELGLRLGGAGAVIIGGAGGSLAQALARAAGSGAALAGSTVKFHDGRCAACGAWLGRYYALPSLFVAQRGAEIRLWVRDGQGREFDPPALSGPCPGATGESCLLTGADRAWAVYRAAGVRWEGAAAVEGCQPLALALERMGCTVVSRPGKKVPLLQAGEDGFTLTVRVGEQVFHPPGEDALAAAVGFLTGGREGRPG